MTTLQTAPSAERRIRYRRIVGMAFLLELTLVVVTTPIQIYFGSPFIAESPADHTVFFVMTPILCFVIGGVFGWWTVRPLTHARLLHGALVGIVAFAIYLVVCSIPPESIPDVVAKYGAANFALANGLRLLGCLAGSAIGGQRA
jgi:hypothetical protein